MNEDNMSMLRPKNGYGLPTEGGYPKYPPSRDPYYDSGRRGSSTNLGADYGRKLSYDMLEPQGNNRSHMRSRSSSPLNEYQGFRPPSSSTGRRYDAGYPPSSFAENRGRSRPPSERRVEDRSYERRRSISAEPKDRYRDEYPKKPIAKRSPSTSSSSTSSSSSSSSSEEDSNPRSHKPHKKKKSQSPQDEAWKSRCRDLERQVDWLKDELKTVRAEIRTLRDEARSTKTISLPSHSTQNNGEEVSHQVIKKVRTILQQIKDSTQWFWGRVLTNDEGYVEVYSHLIDAEDKGDDSDSSAKPHSGIDRPDDANSAKKRYGPVLNIPCGKWIKLSYPMVPSRDNKDRSFVWIKTQSINSNNGSITNYWVKAFDKDKSVHLLGDFRFRGPEERPRVESKVPEKDQGENKKDKMS